MIATLEFTSPLIGPLGAPAIAGFGDLGQTH